MCCGKTDTSIRAAVGHLKVGIVELQLISYVSNVGQTLTLSAVPQLA